MGFGWFANFNSVVTSRLKQWKQPRKPGGAIEGAIATNDANRSRPRGAGAGHFTKRFQQVGEDEKCVQGWRNWIFFFFQRPSSSTQSEMRFKSPKTLSVSKSLLLPSFADSKLNPLYRIKSGSRTRTSKTRTRTRARASSSLWSKEGQNQVVQQGLACSCPAMWTTTAQLHLLSRHSRPRQRVIHLISPTQLITSFSQWVFSLLTH